MKIQFIDFNYADCKYNEHDVANCDAMSAFKTAMKYLKDNNKNMAPAVRIWTEDNGCTAILDYGSHSEFVRFKGTPEEVIELIDIK